MTVFGFNSQNDINRIRASVRATELKSRLAVDSGRRYPLTIAGRRSGGDAAVETGLNYGYLTEDLLPCTDCGVTPTTAKAQPYADSGGWKASGSEVTITNRVDLFINKGSYVVWGVINGENVVLQWEFANCLELEVCEDLAPCVSFEVTGIGPAGPICTTTGFPPPDCNVINDVYTLIRAAGSGSVSGGDLSCGYNDVHLLYDVPCFALPYGGLPTERREAVISIDQVSDFVSVNLRGNGCGAAWGFSFAEYQNGDRTIPFIAANPQCSGYGPITLLELSDAPCTEAPCSAGDCTGAMPMRWSVNWTNDNVTVPCEQFNRQWNIRYAKGCVWQERYVAAGGDDGWLQLFNQAGEWRLELELFSTSPQTYSWTPIPDAAFNCNGPNTFSPGNGVGACLAAWNPGPTNVTPA